MTGNLTMTEPQLVNALRKRFAPPEYAFLEQVRSRTGYGGEIRTADAMAMSLWPSRGFDIIGCEIKVDRRDWIREKQAPAKAEEICRHVDRWYVVVGDEKIVEDGELPQTWGLLVPGPKRGTLVAKVEAPKLDPGPITRPFLAAILRNVEQAKRGMIPKREMALALEQARDEIRNAPKPPKTEQDREIAFLKQDLAGLRDAIKRFEDASGVKMDCWDSKRIGDAVALVRSLGLQDTLVVAEQLALQIRRSGTDLGEAVKCARAAMTGP